MQKKEAGNRAIALRLREDAAKTPAKKEEAQTRRR